MTRIIVDAYGGDHAPLEVLRGSALAAAEYGVTIILTGDEAALRAVAAENQISLDGMEFANASQVITMEDAPGDIMKKKSDSSMAVGLKLLAEGKGDAFVSGGNSGALLYGSTFIVKRIKGISRAAMAPVLPSNEGPYMLIDSGANAECRPEHLVQFALMGSAYMEKVLGVEKPRVGLVNIGVEEHKGTPLQQDAYQLLREREDLNFTGNLEARDIPAGLVDVAVADGFTGNVVLKLTEGLGMMFYKNIKEIFATSLVGKVAAAMLMKKLKAFKKKLDYSEQGGAPLLGVTRPVIKAHGSSNAVAFKNAIRQAKQCVESGVVEKITESIDGKTLKKGLFGLR